MEGNLGFRWIFLLFAVAVTAFIWQQSTVPAPQSAEISDAVRDVVVEAVGGEETAVGSFVDRFVRKIAHFVEFSLLGLCVEAYFLHRHAPKLLLCRLAIGGFVASFDEFLQIFTGRGASVKDVLLDLSGFAFASLTLAFLGWGIAYIQTKGTDGDAVAHTEKNHV